MQHLLAAVFAPIFLGALVTSPGLAQEGADPSAAPTSSEGEPVPATEAGQDLDLFAVLETFKASENVGDFEKRINDPEGGIVNLDLNQDEEVDFVGVFEQAEGDVHVLMLRAFLGPEESQDVASIELERVGEDVTVQVVGDPGIYGPDYIVEPDLGEQSARATYLALRPAGTPVVIASADGRWWPRFADQEEPRFADKEEPHFADPEEEAGALLAAVVVVRTWPTVTVIYTSGYRVYYSPYRWHRYPTYYRARRPVARSHYRYRTAHYRHHHRYTTRRRSARASTVYRNNTVASTRVPKARPATAAQSPANPSRAASPATTPTRRPTTAQSAPSRSRPSTSPSRAGQRGASRGVGGAGPGRRR